VALPYNYWDTGKAHTTLPVLGDKTLSILIDSLGTIW